MAGERTPLRRAQVLMMGWDEPRTFGGTDRQFLVIGGRRGKFLEDFKVSYPPALGELTLLGKKMGKIKACMHIGVHIS